jgi:hypothetical protein
LHQIWDMADSKKQGFLLQRDFAIAMRLVSMAQQGQTPAIAQIQSVTKLPKFADIPVPSSLAVPMTEQEKYKYDNLFLQADANKDGFVDGMEAKTYFGKANVPTNALAIIWSLAERDKDGKLNKAEFRLAMHLIYWTLKGEQLPDTLPEGLVQSASDGITDLGRSRAISAPAGPASTAPLISQPIQPLPNTPSLTPLQPTYQQVYPNQSSFVQPEQQSFVQHQQQPYVQQSFGQPVQQSFGQPVQQSFGQPLQGFPPQNTATSSSTPKVPAGQAFSDPFGNFPSSSGDLIFTPAPAKHNYDQSKFITQHTLPGATFEQRANFSNELSSAIGARKKP